MKRLRSQYVLTAVKCAIIIFIISSSAAAGVAYVKWDSPGKGSPAVFDGLSWDTAFPTVQGGINAASSGDEVWVAAGTYVENLTLKDGVALYGGFSGAETAFAQRHWTANKTVLDGAKKASVVTISLCPSALTRLDGFTITNGTMSSSPSGGGIFCSQSSPTIANNVLTGNSAQSGSAIYCEQGSPLITGNTITQNLASSQAAIYYTGGSPAIIRNTITGNQSGGIYSYFNADTPRILSNKITDNKGRTGGGAGGIYISDGGATIVANNLIARNTGYYAGGLMIIKSSLSTVVANNTIAANSGSFYGGVGLYNPCTFANNIVALNSTGVYGITSATPWFKNNIVFGNGSRDFDNPSPGLIAALEYYKNYVEDPSFVNAVAGDYHVQPHSPCVDRGDDTVLAAGLTDVDGEQRVFGTHVDIGADESYATAWPEGAAIRVSPTGSDAYSGMSWSKPKRTIQAAIDVSAPKSGEVWVKAGMYTYTQDYYNLITFRPQTRIYGGFNGTEISRDQRNWLTNPTILDGSNRYTVIWVKDAGTAECVVDGFTIRNGTSSQGQSCGGILCQNSKIMIRNNTITSSSYSGILCIPSSTGSPFSVSILNNRITGHRTPALRAVYIGAWCNALIANNLFAGNSSQSALYCTMAGASVVNNTFVGNSGTAVDFSTWGGALPVSVSSNIIAFNGAGLRLPYAKSTVMNNCVYGNTGFNYTMMTDPTGTLGNISLDPLFLNRTSGDYHLLPGSPCIDKGTNTGILSTDLDSFPRPMDGDGNGVSAADIGAFETPSTAFAKTKLPDGSSIGLTTVAVTGASIPRPELYVENTSRSNGIRVASDSSFDLGQLVNVFGTIQTDSTTGERFVLPSAGWPKSVGSTASIRPFVLAGRQLGGGASGLQDGVWGKELVKTPDKRFELQWVKSEFLNNIGLLVTAFGKVTYVGDGFFYVDDGSALNDGSGHVGAKVLATGLTLPPLGMAKVTGISSCEKNAEGKIVRVLKVRKQDDITPL